MSTENEINVIRDGYLGIIEFNRPSRQNAFTWAMYRDLDRILDELEDDDAIRVVILRGAGPGFSSGFDMKEPYDSDDFVAKHRQGVRLAQNARVKMWNFAKPSIAQIHGYCLGGAHDLALVCDAAVAAADAKMGVPEIKYGMGTPTLLMPYMAGLRRSKELLLTGRLFSGTQAEEYGLVNYAVPLDQLEDKVLELAEEFAQIPQPAFILEKRNINRAIEMSGFLLATQTKYDVSMVGKLWKSPDVEEFNAYAAENGMTAALRWRRDKYAKRKKAE